MELSKLYNLSYITRYSNTPRIKDENVAEHSFFVAIEVLNLYLDYDFNLGEAIIMSITHDIPEADTDDVNHLIKKKYPKLAKELKIVEKEIVETYPDFIKKPIFEFDKMETFESVIVNMADAIQCMTYSKNEIKLGNKGYMVEVYDNSKKRVTEVKNFIKLKFKDKIRK